MSATVPPTVTPTVRPDLVVAGRGVGLLPRGRASRRGVSVVRLRDPSLFLRAYAVTRRGRDSWPPLRAVLERLAH